MLATSWGYPWANWLHPLLPPCGWRPSASRAPSCPPVVGGLVPQGLGLETGLIDKNVQNQCLQPLGGILGLIGCILSCPPAVVGGLRPQGLALETVLIDKNKQNQCLQPLGLISCILSCPPVVGGVQYPPGGRQNTLPVWGGITGPGTGDIPAPARPWDSFLRLFSGLSILIS